MESCGGITRELQLARQWAVSAGGLLMGHYQQRPLIERKPGGEPVTVADHVANNFLIAEIARDFPDDGIISEESPDDPGRGGKSRVWIIDPLDGTQEFVEQQDEFAVMIGLAIDGEAVLGVVYQPVTGKLYQAARGLGAFLEEHETVRPLQVSGETDPQRMTIALSRSHPHSAVDEVSRRLLIGHSIRSGSLGLKLGLICEGRAHLYLDLSGRTSLWDTCAPEALLAEAGGRVTDLKGLPLIYNKRELRHRNGVIASNGPIHERVVEAVSRV